MFPRFRDPCDKHGQIYPSSCEVMPVIRVRVLVGLNLTEHKELLSAREWVRFPPVKYGNKNNANR